jgi:ankyrin repeat protein
MLQKGADVNVKDFHGFTALHLACMLGWTPTAKMLVSAGADANARTITHRTPLMYCGKSSVLGVLVCIYLCDNIALLFVLQLNAVTWILRRLC